MTTSTETKARSTFWNKNTRHNSANITLSKTLAHLLNSANLPMDKMSSDNPMTHSHQTSESRPLVPSIPTSRPTLADTWKRKANAHLVMVAHSITTTMRREIWLIHSQIFLKVLLFLQWMRRFVTTIRTDTTTITIRTMERTTNLNHQSAHSNSAPWTNSHHLSSRSQALLKWLPLEVLTPTNTLLQPHFQCNQPSKAFNLTDNHPSYSLLQHQCNRCSSNQWCQTIKGTNRHHKIIATRTRTKTTSVTMAITTRTSTQDHLRRVANIATRRKSKDKTAPQRWTRRARKTKSKENMSPSNKRTPDLRRRLN